MLTSPEFRDFHFMDYLWILLWIILYLLDYQYYHSTHISHIIILVHQYWFLKFFLLLQFLLLPYYFRTTAILHNIGSSQISRIIYQVCEPHNEDCWCSAFFSLYCVSSYLVPTWALVDPEFYSKLLFELESTIWIHDDNSNSTF